VADRLRTTEKLEDCPPAPKPCLPQWASGFLTLFTFLMIWLIIGLILGYTLPPPSGGGGGNSNYND